MFFIILMGIVSLLLVWLSMSTLETVLSIVIIDVMIQKHVVYVFLITVQFDEVSHFFHPLVRI